MASLLFLKAEYIAGRDLILPFEAARHAFKRIEFLLEFTDDQRHAYFNGPPVVRETSHPSAFHVIQPDGMQVLEEMICEKNAHIPTFDVKLTTLIQQTTDWREYLQGQNFGKSEWITAVQLHLIRIETLSLSGFDRPCLGVSMDELIISMETLHDIVAKWSSATDGQAKFLEAIHLLKQTSSIEQLPLTLFIIDHLQYIRRAISKMGIPNESICLATPYDLSASSLYDARFLNASYYSTHGVVQSLDHRKKELGQRLFFDPILSGDGNISCATCHHPDKFFTDGLEKGNADIAERLLKRNTPSLVHAAYQAAYMYDGRSTSLEDQMLHVFNNEKEFNNHTSGILASLQENNNYRYLFETAYPGMHPHAVNLHSLTDALAVYVRTLTAHNSAFDRYMRNELDHLGEDAIHGYQLFMTKAKCGTCHFPPTFSGLLPPFYKESEFENLGVPSRSETGEMLVDHDNGRYDFFVHEAFKHFFKTSTIRNTEHTGPYMHNGIFLTLDEVIDFYNVGGGRGQGLMYSNQSLLPDSLSLSNSEINDLKSFILSLTDDAYLEYPASE